MYEVNFHNLTLVCVHRVITSNEFRLLQTAHKISSTYVRTGINTICSYRSMQNAPLIGLYLGNLYRKPWKVQLD